MIFADTGYFIALLKERDELHERALRWSDVIREPVLTSDYVLVEVVNNASVPIIRRRLHVFLERLRGASQIEVVSASPALMEAGIAFHKARSDKEWSLTDCISFIIMQERGIMRALAHDHHFEQAGFEALLRREP
ncbi:hypothetical protein B1R32_1034 [Abditibacterium utsteinense]|uniref:PIN domain-containing protein n=1 Tax=Abditibacterium utsteinense TaxID=1960156 RepID=A0A2S8SVA7_9BACT|nr:PIN domain-containing protein [Abditibacterium utsteinense]PQV64737.1 hypothetical protein B1R32_1034 [Abditibacterium utsteinense]